MELLTSQKSIYLLDAGLDVLHEQSNEWLSEIAFWRDEVAFYYSFLLMKSIKAVPIHLKNNFEKAESDIREIAGSGLNKLQNEIELHEKYLAQLLDNKTTDQEKYRQKHRELTILITQFNTRFKKVKSDIFKLIELVKKESA